MKLPVRQNQVQALGVTRRSVLFAAVAVSWFAGCFAPPPVKVGGDPDEAATVLGEVLEEWKKGKKVDDLKEEDPPVIARDPDWEAGGVLKSYEVNKTPREDGGNWRVDATVTVSGPGLPTGPQSVSYSVSIVPKVVVMRMDAIE